MASGEVAERERVPVMGTSCTSPLVTKDRRYYFRACFIDPFQGAAAAAYAYNEMGLRRAAVLFDRANDYCVGLAGYFVQAFRELGGRIVANEKYFSGDRDFSRQLEEILRADPEILFMPAYFNEGVQILMQARASGATFRIMGGDAMDNPNTSNLSSDVIEGFMHTTMPYDRAMPDMSDAARQFTADWLSTYAKEPNGNAAVGYSAYQLVMEGLRRAGSTDAEAIVEALSSIADLPGVTGEVTINAGHNAEMPVGIIEYRNSSRVFLGVINPGAQPDEIPPDFEAGPEPQPVAPADNATLPTVSFLGASLAKG